jgi:hypothetical protein
MSGMTLGQKRSATMTADAMRAYPRVSLTKAHGQTLPAFNILAKGTVHYVDVFNEMHAVELCWKNSERWAMNTWGCDEYAKHWEDPKWKPTQWPPF